MALVPPSPSPFLRRDALMTNDDDNHLDWEPSYSPGEAQGEGESLSESYPRLTSGEALSDSLRTPKDQLQVALMEASETPLRILGPDLYAQAVRGLFKGRDTIAEVNNTGMIVTTLEGLTRFFFRDERSRARYVFQCIMGLTWPCTLGSHEKRELYQKFDEGWTSGELAFLSGLPFGELETYREALVGDPLSDKGTLAVPTSDQPQ